MKLQGREVYDPMSLPCGGTAYYDPHSSNFAYRCINCMKVVGSLGMSKSCKDAMEKDEIIKRLGGQGWDYFA
jgi:hypothetical protein